MDKNTWIGFLLIAAIFVGFTMLNRPSKEELAKRQHEQDSIAALRLAEAEAQRRPHRARKSSFSWRMNMYV